MYPPSFDYYRAESVTDALERLAAEDDRDVRLLAGGHSLLPDLKAGEAAPDAVVDLGRIDELQAISETADGIEIGAMVTYADLVDSTPVSERAPLLAEAAAQVGDVQIRNRGTIGGNLAYAHPGADLPPATLASDARLRIRSPDGRREVPASEFFFPGGNTDITGRELVTAVVVPDAPERTVTYRKWTHPATGYAAVGVAAAVTVEDGTVAEARVAATGAIDRAIRLQSAEAAVVGERPTEATARAAGDCATDDITRNRLRSDPQVSAAYREHRLGVCVRRALATTFQAAGAGPGSDSGRSGGSDTAATDGGETHE